jgi:hypothetical protein
MLARIAQSALLLATGGFLLVALEVKLLGWLPDFPVGLGAAVVLAIAATAGGLRFASAEHRVRSHVVSYMVFLAFALIHAGLAVNGSSLAIQQWRDSLFWPTVVAGVFAQATYGGIRSLGVAWCLGEAFTLLFAAWYGPSFGESTAWATYGPFLGLSVVTLMVQTSLAAESPRRARWIVLACTALLAPVLAATVCLLVIQPHDAQSLLLPMAVLRSLIFTAASMLPAAKPFDARDISPDRDTRP